MTRPQQSAKTHGGVQEKVYKCRKKMSLNTALTSGLLDK